MSRQTKSRDRLFWPVFWALMIHVVLLSLLFVSFSGTPELPPSRPMVKATLYQLESQNMATSQTSQKIAGEAERTRTQDYAQEQLEQKKREQEQEAADRRKAEEERRVAAQKAEEQKKLAEQKAAEEKRAAEQKKLAEQKAAEQKAAEQRKLEMQKAEAARLKAAEEAKKKAEEARQKAEQERKKAEEARKKAAAERKQEEEKKKAAELARQKAEAEKKKREAEQAAKVAAEKARAAERKAQEDRNAAALAELLGDGEPQFQSSVGDRQGEQQAARLDDLIVQLVSQSWSRPDAARNGMQVVLDVEFLADGTISRVTLSRSSGNAAFDNSALAAVRNVARVREIQSLDRATYERFYRKRSMAFRPEDLSQ